MRGRQIGGAAVLGVTCLAFAAALIRGVAMRVRVTGPSMEPALRNSDRVLVSRIAYLCRRPRPGEIVLAAVAAVPGEQTIKRVAAASGWRVPRHRFMPVRTNAGKAMRGEELVVYPGMDGYVLLGDNGPVSVDSRHFGAVPRRAIRGRVWYRYWPPERRGRIG